MHTKNVIILIIIRSYVWSKMLSSYLNAMLTLLKTTSPQPLFRYDCINLYEEIITVMGGYLSFLIEPILQQSYGNSFGGDVVLDTFNNVSRDEDNILDQKYQKQICSDFYYDGC